MSVSNLYATAPNGTKFIKQDDIEVNNLTVDDVLLINGGTAINGGLTIYGKDDANAELSMNFDDDALDCIGSTTGIHFETLDEVLGAIVAENSSAVAGSTIASKIVVKPAIWDGASPIETEMLSVGKDLLTTEVGVIARSTFGAGIEGALGITNVEDYAAADTGKVYKFTLPIAGGTDILTLKADQIAPSGGAGSPPSVVSSKSILSVAPVGPVDAPLEYSVSLGDTSSLLPIVQVQGSSGVGSVYDTKYNIPDGMILDRKSVV